MKIIGEIFQERNNQDDKWGEQNHEPFIWLSILAEEVGEANKAYMESYFRNGPDIEYRKEMVQVAAVALAAIECFDRNNYWVCGKCNEKVADIQKHNKTCKSRVKDGT